ncbi:BTAD domain-containing putative transcriptional regulator [Saccharothrix isguenensis]
MATRADFRVLGRLEVVADGQLIQVSGVKQRVLLASLLLRPNEVVPADALVSHLWGEHPPRTARATLQTYVQRLRRTLGGSGSLATSPKGYRITVAPEELDLLRFRTAMLRVDHLPDPAEQRRTLRSALGEWRGRPLADAVSDTLEAEHLPLLHEERIKALERLFDLELRLGNHREVIGELQLLTTEFPLHERLCGQLMLALRRAGRQAEAFTAYHRLAATLADELGVDPGDELKSLYQAILVNAPDVATPDVADAAPKVVVDSPRGAIPRELPADSRDLVGRDDVAHVVRGLVAPGDQEHLPVVLLSGPPGVGKTALAVHVGHGVAGQFPDGQLYADLRGHVTGSALEPAQVLARFLIALGVPAKQVPSQQDVLVPLYRTTMASRRVLVVLDNAASAQQVRPLLPSTPGCAVIVTSRRELRGLTADGAEPFRLEVLSEGQSQRLIVGAIGEDRVAAEPEEAAELAALCGHLPLALRIAAANLAARRSSSIASFVAALRDGNRLRSLEIEGDTDFAVHTAFEHCYAQLEPEVARAFRLLGLVPGPHFTVDAVAALFGVPRAEAARDLDRLDVANLVSPHGEARYRLHDLLRLYAREQCETVPAAAVSEARRRLYAFYLRHALASADLLFPMWLRLPLPSEDCEPTGAEFDGVAEAVAWMDAECLNIVAAVEDAASDGFVQWACSLAEALRSFLITQGRYLHEGRGAGMRALRAAVEAGDIAAQASMHSTLVSLWVRHNDLSQAMSHCRSELDCRRAMESSEGESRALITLGNLHLATARVDEAGEYVTQGLSLVGVDGNPALRRFGLLNLAFIELHRARLDTAEASVREILAESGAGSEHVSEAEARSILGSVLLLRGLCHRAIGELGVARELCRRGSIPHYESTVLSRLADAHAELGIVEAALDFAQRAVVMAQAAGVRNVEVEARTSLSRACLAAGNYAEALDQSEQALALCERSVVWHNFAQAVLTGAECARHVGDLVRARESVREALEVSRESGQRTVEGRALTELATLDLADAEFADAATGAREAVLIHGRAGAVPDEARASHVLGRILLAQGDQVGAAKIWAGVERRLDRTEIGRDAPIRVLLRRSLSS